MVKLRDGSYQKNGDPVKVLTVPNDISLFFPETHFKVEKSGCCIVYTSGTKRIITKKELEAYNYEDCRVK